MRRGGIYLYISQAILGHSQLEVLVKHNYTNYIKGSGDSTFYLVPKWFNGHVETQILTSQQIDRIEHFTLWSDYGTHKPLLQHGVLSRSSTLI